MLSEINFETENLIGVAEMRNRSIDITCKILGNVLKLYAKLKDKKIPKAWITTVKSNFHKPFYVFSDFKQAVVKQQTAALRGSGKTAYKLLRDKTKNN